MMVSRVGQHCLNLRGAFGALIGYSSPNASSGNIVHRVLQRPHLYRNVLCRKYVSAVNYNGENNLILMGSPGSGKTSVGKALSPKLGMPVVDIDDDFLEVIWNSSVADKLSLEGGDNFVQAEGDAMLKFNAKNCIVSLTGSNPLHSNGMSHISKSGPVFFLDVNSQVILNRLEVMKVNRIVGQTEGVKMADILKYRQQFYENSYDIRIICERDESVDSIAEKVADEWQKYSSRKVYVSTRAPPITGQSSTIAPSIKGPSSVDSTKPVHFLDAVLQGLAPDGGLFVPARGDFPKLTPLEWERLIHCTYQERAIRILERWIHPVDIHPSKLNTMVNQAYSADSFDDLEVVPLVHLHGNQYLMEVFHGPTASFKDAALQLMPQFFTEAVVRSNQEQRYLILVATSGDTGSAVLDGFAKYAGDSGSMVMVLYPENGVSPVQKALMTSGEGSNVHVVGVDSDFDYCQSAIKQIFSNPTINNTLQSSHGVRLSAANSINWGRLLPQVVYHASSYLDLVKKGVLSLGDEFDLCVPTGNFGNILGAVYAKSMGIPINKFICASNENNILTDFFKTGVYDLRQRNLHVTMSPAIDILKSSNLERFLHLMTNGDEVRHYYEQLNSQQYFKVSSQVMEKIRDEWGFTADWCTQEECSATIKSVYQEKGYLLDPHTAVAKTVADRQPITDRPLLICSTAHYGKFASDVSTSLGNQIGNDVLFGGLKGIEGLPTMHRELDRALHKPCIHHGVVEPNVNDIVGELMGFVGRASGGKVKEHSM